MKAATVKELKYELVVRSQKDLVEICLRLAKFKKENKELLTYLLYEAENESAYIKGVKDEIDELFLQINKRSIYYIKKSVRKILSQAKKYIRYSQKKETEAEILIYFCKKLRDEIPGYKRSIQLKNMYNTQLAAVQKAVNSLHEDLQFDFKDDIEDLYD